jgi:hypothetical protein
MDHVEEFGDTLHLIHNDCHPLGRAQDKLAESLRPRAHLAIYVWVEQVDKKRLRKHVSEPGRLACATWSKQKEALLGNRKKPPLKFHFAPQSGSKNSRMRFITGYVKPEDL